MIGLDEYLNMHTASTLIAGPAGPATATVRSYRRGLSGSVTDSGTHHIYRGVINNVTLSYVVAVQVCLLCKITIDYLIIS